MRLFSRLAMTLLCVGLLPQEPIAAQAGAPRGERPVRLAIDQAPSGWLSTTELEPGRGTATTRLFTYGHRVGGRRAVVLQLVCHPGHQREIAIVASEYLTDYRVRNMSTTVTVTSAGRVPIRVDAALQGDYLVYLDHEASSRVLDVLAAAADTVWMSVERGAFPAYEAAFAAGTAVQGAPTADFCSPERPGSPRPERR